MVTSRCDGLSLQARRIWAKTGSKKLEQGHLWGPFYVHMADSAEIARLLWCEWLPYATKELISSSAGLCFDDAEILIAWLAGVHDIGKATPGFQCKSRDLAARVEESGLRIPRNVSGGSSHAAMGQLILQDWFVAQGWDQDVAMTYTSIVGGHHGITPDEGELDEIHLKNRRSPRELLGDEPWQDVQDELIGCACEACNLVRITQKLQDRPLTPFTQILITGLSIVADWIASNTELFPLTNDEDVSWDECKKRAAFAWKSLKLPPPLRLDSILSDDEELFHKRFVDLPKDARLRPAQRAVVQAAREMEESGLLIIEAPMGNGKTEASLLCTEILAKKFGSGGIAYLLPTRATSNAMFARVETWLEKLRRAIGADAQSIQLLHSKAELNDDFTRLRKWLSRWPASSMGDSSASDEGIIAHQWFGGRKRGLLASFVVGTVDQLLMAALNAKHVHLRHLGLAGKVVVIDEVHAYDAYMNVFLDRALQFLGAYGTPVILLSATLPPDRREALIKAYRGQGPKADLLYSAPRLESGAPSYPLITVAPTNKNVGPSYIACERSGLDTAVEIEYLPDDNGLLLGELKDALEGGGCACVIRDTVSRAQHTYELLSGEIGVDVKLVHSRFIGIDRARNDQELLNLLGADSSERPQALIVVGTQVIEQSLDIDFDLMVTDVAPMDLLLQRMGRLHRHQRGEGQSDRPAKLRQARCIITGVEDWTEQWPVIDKGILHVYDRAVLWQTIQVLKDYAKGGTTALNIPGDIASLVERTYGEIGPSSSFGVTSTERADPFSDAVGHWHEEIRGKQTRAKNWILPKVKEKGLLNGWMHNRLNLGDDDYGRAAVRDSQESLEVIVIQEADGLLRILPRIARLYGVPCLLGTRSDEPDDEGARIAALCSVGLPPALTVPWRIDKVISCLENQTPSGWQRSRWLKGQLALVTDKEGRATIECGNEEFNLYYSEESGLEVTKRREGEHVQCP